MSPKFFVVDAATGQMVFRYRWSVRMVRYPELASEFSLSQAQRWAAEHPRRTWRFVQVAAERLVAA